MNEITRIMVFVIKNQSIQILTYSMVLFMSSFLFSCGHESKQNLEVTKISIDDINETTFDELFQVTSKKVRLESNEDIILGADLTFSFFNEDIFVFDKSQKKLLRFGDDGNFKNFIGKEGKGPNEYLKITNFYANDLGVTILFNVGSIAKLYNYTLEGEFVDSRVMRNFLIFDIALFKDNYYLYTSHNKMMHKYRLYKYDLDWNQIEGFLVNDFSGKVLTLYEKNLICGNNSIYLKESLQPIIYEISENEIIPAYFFDFGDFNIPKKYWTMDGVDGYFFLQKNGSALLRHFFTNKEYSLFVIILQKEMSPTILMYLLHCRMDNEFYKTSIQESKKFPYLLTPIGISSENEVIMLNFPELQDDTFHVGNPTLTYYSIKK